MQMHTHTCTLIKCRYKSTYHLDNFLVQSSRMSSYVVREHTCNLHTKLMSCVTMSALEATQAFKWCLPIHSATAHQTIAAGSFLFNCSGVCPIDR